MELKQISQLLKWIVNNYHKIYSNIKLEWMFVETTVYDENINMVWSHIWGGWMLKRIKTKKIGVIHLTHHLSGGWKNCNGEWIFDPTSDIKEAAAK